MAKKLQDYQLNPYNSCKQRIDSQSGPIEAVVLSDTGVPALPEYRELWVEVKS